MTDLDTWAAKLTGTSHVIASVAGEVRFQGTVTGFRRVFAAECGSVTVASDRADALAFLLDAPLDERRLALHLLYPPVLHPLTDLPLWRGVRHVPTDSCLVLGADRESRQVRWWAPPEPQRPLAEGARALREALAAAVAARVKGQELVSSDLSGLDSTSVCSLAVRSGARVVAYTAASPDPLEDDVFWSHRTAAALPSLEHHVIPVEELPNVYHGLLDLDEPMDEPCRAAADHARWLAIARRAAARGSRLHLTGFGGDELLTGSPFHLRSLLARRPAFALRQLRGLAAKYRWPPGLMLRQLWGNRSYSSWLLGVADRLTAPPPTEDTPPLGWGPPPLLPPWVTADAADAVRELIRAEAPTAEPLSARREHHGNLLGMLDATRPLREVDWLAARAGLRLAAPYCDDRVLEAALSVRPEEKYTPWHYKPLLLEAMRGTLPDEILSRQTKAGGVNDLDDALRENRADMLRLWEESQLGGLGLIDAGKLRELCRHPLEADPRDLHGALYQSVACEVWLRTLRGTSIPSTGVRP
ncbi:asparagine synthase-related protein [Streptomyces sp. P1-3]|uniref:asparagine synthase-related protein n=1 Tax=Streptomyces sp. P1-3 TaxID=3421658 RepID=UPI003D36AED3